MRTYLDSIFSRRSIDEQALQWLALALTPGLGPTRVRHLVDRFVNVAAIFRASLTELEATGLGAVDWNGEVAGTGAGGTREGEGRGRTDRLAQ